MQNTLNLFPLRPCQTFALGRRAPGDAHRSVLFAALRVGTVERTGTCHPPRPHSGSRRDGTLAHGDAKMRRVTHKCDGVTHQVDGWRKNATANHGLLRTAAPHADLQPSTLGLSPAPRSRSLLSPFPLASVSRSRFPLCCSPLPLPPLAPVPPLQFDRALPLPAPALSRSRSVSLLPRHPPRLRRPRRHGFPTLTRQAC